MSKLTLSIDPLKPTTTNPLPSDVGIHTPGWVPGGEEEEKDVGWVKAVLKMLADWLVDEIIRPALEGAVWLINWIRAELRYWTYEAMKFLTEITETTEGMIATLAIVFCMAVTVPQLVETFMASSVGVMLKKIVDWTKEKVGNILEAVHFVDLMAVHEVLLVIWPKWRDAFTPFQDAISALAEQLGQGSGYIHAWLSVTHGLSMVGTSLLNIDPQVGEIRALEQSQLFMEKIDSKFREYSHDPGLIARDIMEEIYIPYAEEIRNTQTGVIDSIKDTREYMLTLNGSLEGLDDSFEYLINATLPEFQDQMRENVAGIRQVVNQYSRWIEEVILPPIDISIRALEERAGIIEQANAVARAKLNNPIEIFMATEFQDEETQLATYRYLEEMVKAAMIDGQEDFTTIIAEGRNLSIEATRDTIMQTQAPAWLALELPIGKLPPAAGPSRIPGWNVGEY